MWVWDTCGCAWKDPVQASVSFSNGMPVTLVELCLGRSSAVSATQYEAMHEKAQKAILFRWGVLTKNECSSCQQAGSITWQSFQKELKRSRNMIHGGRVGVYHTFHTTLEISI